MSLMPFSFMRPLFRSQCNLRKHRGSVLCRQALAGFVIVMTAGWQTDVCASNPEEDPVYLKKVRPLLDTQCVKCHGPEKQKASLRLDTFNAMMEGGDSGPAVVPGDVEGSNLITAVCYEDADLQMPPDGKLDEEQIEMLKKWVGEMGG